MLNLSFPFLCEREREILLQLCLVEFGKQWIVDRLVIFSPKSRVLYFVCTDKNGSTRDGGELYKQADLVTGKSNQKYKRIMNSSPARLLGPNFNTQSDV